MPAADPDGRSAAARATVIAIACAVGAAACLALLVLGAPAARAGETVWLCRPGAAGNPCTGNLTATLVAPDGTRTVRRARSARRAPVDCFYVYPTVSDQPRTNATLAIDPEQRAIARFQAARFSSVCRIWAPMYRQFTLQALMTSGAISDASVRVAYAGVRDAWREYLARHNRGRGVVLIGHSQGTFMLRRLLAREIEPRRAVRRRLVSALLIGGDVTVRRGRDRGGDFARVPACRSATQTGCVVAYSTYGRTPPPDSVFGRVTGPASARREVLCTNPAALGGGSGELEALMPTTPFPGTIGLGVNVLTGPLPSVATPWLGFVDSYRARCVRRNGASVLLVHTVPGARVLTPVPTPAWGLHLADVNLALGNLVALVGRQSAAYAGRRGGTRRRSRARRRAPALTGRAAGQSTSRRSTAQRLSS